MILRTQGAEIARFKRRRVLSVVLVVLTASAGLVVVLPRPTTAQSDYPIEYGWIGWDGNSIIYPTEDRVYECLPAVSLSSVQKGVFSEIPANNSLVLGTSQVAPSNVTGIGGQDCGPRYGYSVNQDKFYADIPLYTVSGTNFSKSGLTVYEAGSAKLGFTFSGLPIDSKGSISSGFYKGVNVTTGNVSGMSGDEGVLLAVIDSGLVMASLVFPEAAILLAPVEIMNDFAGAAGAYSYSSSSVSDLSNYSQYGSGGNVVVWGLAKGGNYSSTSCKYDANWGTCGQNVFSEATSLTLSVPDPQDVTGGSLTLSGANQFWAGSALSSQGPEPQFGANATLSYLIEPAVSIGGFVHLWPGGPPAANAQVNLQQTPPAGAGGSTTDMQIYTNSQGYWHFFAEPGATYGGSYVIYNNGLGSDSTPLAVPSTSASETGQNVTPSYTNFNNVGEIEGKVSGSTGATIEYPDMTLTDNSNGAATSVVGDSSGSYSNLFYYPTNNGLNSFTLLAAATNYCPSSRTITDLKAGQVYTEDFTLSAGCHGGGGCVAFGTPILTTDGYVPVQDLSPGDSVVEYDLSTGHLVSGTLVSANTTQVSQIIDVNRGLLRLTPTDQPVFIRNATYEGWLHNPQSLTTIDQLFDPLTETWVNVTSVQLVSVHVTVYDVISTNLNDFVANGVLLDAKLG